MKVWFDTEFIEDGKTIELISIGLICEDGLSYYAENSECDHSRASPWVKKNVFPHLVGGQSRAPRRKIASEIIRIVGDAPEFWAYYASYDWVVLCQLYGTMMDLPKGWPMFVHDVQQLRMERGNPGLPVQVSAEHNALNDALWTREAWQFLQ